MDSMERSGSAARGRRLVQHAAVLLYADRPLDDFLGQLGRVLKHTWSAREFFVWLSAPNSNVELRYGSGETDSVHALAQQCSDTGRSISIEEAGHSEIYAPIVYGNEALGVAAVVSMDGTKYSDDDVRLFEAISYYIAIAIANQSLLRSVVAPYRRVRQFVIALLFAAVLASLALIGFALAHLRQMNEQSAAAAQMHVNGIAERLEANANDAGQLARSIAVFGETDRGDRASTEFLLAEMLRSGPRDTIYGAGLWYAPYAYASGTRLYGPYVHRGKRDPGHVVLTYVWSSAKYNYPSQPWYRLAQNSRGVTSFTQPYFDTDLVYITAVHPMYDQRGRFVGVSTVDMSLPYLQRFVATLSSPSRLLYITAGNNQTFLFPDARALLHYAQQHGAKDASLTSVPLPITKQFIAQRFGGSRMDTVSPIALLGWTVHESDSAPMLSQSTRDLWFLTAVALLALWICTGLGAAAILHSRTEMLERIRLELEHSRLRNEVDQRLAAEQRLVETSKNDPLTGLPARVALLDTIAAALDERCANPQVQYAVAFIDLDRFVNVNEALGYARGDEVLRALAERLVRSCAQDCVVGRYGGDEFLLVKRISSAFDAIKLAESVLSSLGEAFAAGGESVFVRASMGIVILDDTYNSPDEVVRDADIAMYRAKSKGTLRFEIFNAEMRAQAEHRVRLEAQLRHAVTRDDFFVEYQPIVPLRDGHIEGFEALVRWKPDGQATMYPSEFVESAERIGAIVPIDFKVLKSVRHDIDAWRSRDGKPIYVAVNMSALHFATRGLADQLVHAVEDLHFPPNTLHIEITETALMRDREVATEALAQLRAAGVRLSIDDFGTGYSSLAYVERFHVDALKIDKSFVETMTEHSQAAEIVRAVSALGRALGLEVIAEGIETVEQATLLREAGVSRGQGFIFSPPVRPDGVSRLLSEGLVIS